MWAFSLQVKRLVNVRVDNLQKLCIATRFLEFRLRGWFVPKRSRRRSTRATHLAAE
jgi:hypothetical protein